MLYYRELHIKRILEISNLVFGLYFEQYIEQYSEQYFDKERRRK